MPATTRSKTKQSHLEDFGAKDTRHPHDAPKSRKDSSASKDNPAKESDSKRPKAKTESTSKTKPSPSKTQPEQKQSQSQSPSRKRKHPENAQPSTVPSSKKSRQQQQHLSTTSDEQTQTPDTKPIIINRSPVLQLWSACVAQHLYPELSWSTSLAVGSAISTLCAIAKGKSISTIEEREKTPDEKAAQTAQRRAAEAAEAGADREVQVMGFRLYIKGQDVILQGKPKHGNEGALKAKFGGEENYGRAKTVMDDAITSWTGSDTDRKSELNAKAFRMYEEFRPNVQSGQGGWGKKGALELGRVREVVARK
ncbi:hypothetical protein LTR99_004386 [Exophiala xenobiotica]|uniref:Uncharacterized protein n=1 Tax=Vermiconidia calcicola TaxID=1690605 RepID=A0AAV9QAM0_9PEZI|nr:hypothetical protein LTR96_001506 [Exophiala xenobiotica]KAK5528757.1 hypothetical protein LTR23_010937 [Chaetothyriales sp. CCFEE 6169]KAK5539666.1 hypothetical protein LTR25_003371 [Vermiconidia calcicola]KAK5303930.1 hypothetical protein LTR99_004386 [Exophiala xenobiotica]KAK5338541.1 hypothetical protein LTR98_004941 [Exophiala xenobiotica]